MGILLTASSFEKDGLHRQLAPIQLVLNVFEPLLTDPLSRLGPRSAARSPLHCTMDIPLLTIPPLLLHDPDGNII